MPRTKSDRDVARFDTLAEVERVDKRAAKSVEGWILMVSGIHAEAQEEDLLDAFGDYGIVRNLHLNLDRRTGYAKGYALLEFADHREAKASIKGMDGATILGQRIRCEWAFMHPPRK
ncbi:MAG: hypothetical protein KVP17_003442 [Porospora cf. gigantea B]|uniref:uncharacterized protein n=2 Tax=Porospora cf. gigantea B TaxID=2853592 RepID=UPI003571AA6C|nr:MAG: hypothetical protein KVP17_003442 [Porospora cf. gigantea B]